MKNHTTLLLGLVLFAGGCSGDDLTTVEDERLLGYWFKCELGLADSCAVLDDDGHQFATGGELYLIEEADQRTLPECPGSNCFAGNLSAINVTRTLIGTYSYDGSTLAVEVGSTCQESVAWVPTNPTSYSGTCLEGLMNATDGLVRRFGGTVTVN